MKDSRSKQPRDPFGKSHKVRIIIFDQEIEE